jgi:O-antigen ligase
VQPPTPSDDESSRFETILWALVALALLATPFVIIRPAVDVFRTAKDVVFETLALAIFAAAAVWLLVRERAAESFRVNRQAAIVAIACVAWTAVATLASLQPDVSLLKPLFVFCLAVFFCASMMAVSRRGIVAVLLVLVPAAANAVLAFLQSTWSVLLVTRDPISKRMWTTGLIGNPNELGAYFVLPLIAAIAAAIAWPRFRWAFGLLVAVIGLGVVAGQSVTSLIAAACGVAAMTLLPGARMLRWVAIAVFVAMFAGVSLHPGARTRVLGLAESMTTGRVVEMTSFRWPAWHAAAVMFRERPLLGVGPGVFSARYMSYRLRLEETHPEWLRVGNSNFGEAHNDHLQLLAETGLPGYLLFLAALGMLARLTWRRRTDEPSPEQVFARSFAFPAAAAFFVLALAHFPLSLTSMMVPTVFLAGLCFAWGDPDAVR